MEDKEFNEKYEKLKNSKFKQQKLSGWRPLPTISCITIIFISFAVFFIVFGIIILVFISQLKEFIFRYDEYCQKYYKDSTNCEVSIPIPYKMKKPILIYYQIDGISQNHRFYMDNKSDKQLKGEEVTKEDLEKNHECEYALTNKQVRVHKNFLGDDINNDEVAIPCGLIARSYLRDEFKDWTFNGKSLNPNVTDIVYKSDVDYYKNSETEGDQWINMTDEHFINWMRISPFSSPRKFYGKIESDDIEGELKMKIQINNHLSRKKYIILSTRNVFGGKSYFLGIMYIIFGIICLIAAVVYINAYTVYHRKDN